MGCTATTPTVSGWLHGAEHGDILRITGGLDQKWWDHGLYEMTSATTATKMTFWRGWRSRFLIWWRGLRVTLT